MCPKEKIRETVILPHTQVWEYWHEIACVSTKEEKLELKSKLYTPWVSFLVSKEVNVCPTICFICKLL